MKPRGRDTSLMVCSIPSKHNNSGINHKHKVKLWSSLDNNTCLSVGGVRRENKRYTSVTNDEFDDEVIDNFTNEADDL
jgi:hypothetical protein